MNRFAVWMGVVALAVVTWWAFSPRSPAESAPPGVRVGAGDAYNPVTAGEDLPEGFRQLLPRDGIEPIYGPQFIDGLDAGWAGDIEVIGVSSGDEAKAYPVSFLTRHEMVNDFIAGDPILVTW